MTKTANISKMSSSHFVSIVCHQHRCSLNWDLILKQNNLYFQKNWLHRYLRIGISTWYFQGKIQTGDRTLVSEVRPRIWAQNCLRPTKRLKKAFLACIWRQCIVLCQLYKKNDQIISRSNVCFELVENSFELNLRTKIRLQKNFKKHEILKIF